MRCKRYLPLKTFLTIYRQGSAEMNIDEQTISAPSTDPESLWRQANDLAGQGRLLDAVPLYLKLSDLWPERAPVWSNLGIVLAALERHEEARDCLQRALQMQPGNPTGHYKLGQIHEHLGTLEEAAKCYLAAVAEDPFYLNAWNSLADLSLQAGELDLVEQYLQPALEIDPNDPPANFLLGNLLRRQSDFDGAARHLSISYNATGDPACGNNLANVMSQQDRVDEAIELLQALLQSHPDHTLAWNTLGGQFLRQERFQEARDAMARALALDSDFHGARHSLARCLKFMRDFEGAKVQFIQLLELDPENVVAMKDMAFLWEYLEEPDAAMALREKALALAPRDAGMMADHANHLHGLRRYDEALAFAERALRLEPKNLWAQLVVADNHFVCKRLEDANIWLNRILSSDTEDTVLLYLVAALFEKTKQAARAIGVYERILELRSVERKAALRIVDLKMSMCDWDNYEEICRQQIAQIKAGSDNVDVFNLQALPVDYAFIGMAARQAAETLAVQARSYRDTQPLVHAAPRRGRIRLGYALPYTWFHSFPMVHKDIVECHDRTNI